MKKIICFLTIIVVSLSPMTVKSETFFKGEITSGNFYVDMLGIWATYGINKAHGTGGFLYDNYLTMSSLSVDVGSNNYSVSTSSDSFNKSLFGFKFQELLNGLGTGIKLGYSNHYEFFVKQWGLYGSIGTTYNYYVLDVNRVGTSAQTFDNSVLKVSPGVGAQIDFGKVTSPVSVRLDVNLRYDIPILYSGDMGSGASCLNSGLSPRISLTVGGATLMKKGMNIGVFYEWMTYDLFKPSEYFIEPYQVSGSTCGINFTMYPWK